VEGKLGRNNVEQEGQWKGHEREIMWNSRVIGRERRGKQIGPVRSIEGEIKSNNVTQHGQMKEKKILSFKVIV
jgi:hypothetical protein